MKVFLSSSQHYGIIASGVGLILNQNILSEYMALKCIIKDGLFSIWRL